MRVSVSLQLIFNRVRGNHKIKNFSGKIFKVPSIKQPSSNEVGEFRLIFLKEDPKSKSLLVSLLGIYCSHKIIKHQQLLQDRKIYLEF